MDYPPGDDQRPSVVNPSACLHNRQLLLAVAKAHVLCEGRDRFVHKQNQHLLEVTKTFKGASRVHEQAVQHYTATYNNTAGTLQQENNYHNMYTTASYMWATRKANSANVKKQETLDATLRQATERPLGSEKVLATAQIQLDNLNQKSPLSADQGSNGGLRSAAMMGKEHLGDAVNLAVERVESAQAEEEATRKAVDDNYIEAKGSGVRDSCSTHDAREDFSRATAEVDQCYHKFKAAKGTAATANKKLLEAETAMKQAETTKNSMVVTVKQEWHTRITALGLANAAHCQLVAAKNAPKANHSDPDTVDLSPQALAKVVVEVVVATNASEQDLMANTDDPIHVNVKKRKERGEVGVKGSEGRGAVHRKPGFGRDARDTTVGLSDSLSASTSAATALLFLLSALVTRRGRPKRREKRRAENGRKRVYKKLYLRNTGFASS